MSEKSTMKASRSLYSIQNAPFSYCTGHLNNGYQVLTASDDETGAPTFPRVEFDGEGNLLAAYDKETEYTSSDTLTFTPGTILVKPFFIPELWFHGSDFFLSEEGDLESS